MEEVSDATGISTKVLQALEEEDRDELPAEVYIKAFYKKYAQYLGLDSDTIQARLQQKNLNIKQQSAKTSSFNTVITIKGQEENFFTEALRRLFIPIVVLLSGLLVYWIYKNYLTPYIPFSFF